jgi:hypothetical protein
VDVRSRVGQVHPLHVNDSAEWYQLQICGGSGFLDSGIS